jgi:ribose transport system ATP-binding protein
MTMNSLTADVTTRPSAPPLLEVRGIGKRFGGVMALEGVDLCFRPSSIHAVLGENGAGKSTLIKIIGGVLSPDAGTLSVNGIPRAFFSPMEAIRQGIVCVFQELSLIPDLTVAGNICIMNEQRNAGVFIDSRRMIMRAEELLAEIGCEDIDPREQCRNLPLSRRQLVECAKALGRRPRILILDEATSALKAQDAQRIHAMMGKLRSTGAALIYITHHLREAEMLADTCTVLRNGRRIETFEKGTRSIDSVVDMMIGHSIAKSFPPKKDGPGGRPLLRVQGLSWLNSLRDVSFAMDEGEIIGLGGLDGQGQREVLLSLFGVLKGTRGEITLNGRRVTITSPAAAKSAAYRMALIPEDRKTEGLVLPMSIAHNITLSVLDRASIGPIISTRRDMQMVNAMVRKLNIKVSRVENRAASLSGGNQQKLVLAKWLLVEAKLLFLLDPTRGIDVGTKQEIYVLLRQLAAEGVGIILFSTDIDELVGLCDRVLVLYKGTIVKTLAGSSITEQNILKASFNLVTDNDDAVSKAVK